MNTFRNSIVKLAFEQPDLQPLLIPLLQKRAMEFNSRQELEKYMKEHPGANRRNHTVKHQDRQSEGMSNEEKYHARKMKETFEWAQMHVESALSSRRNPDYKLIDAAFDKLEEHIRDAKKATKSPKGKETLKFYQDEIKALRKGLDEGMEEKDTDRSAKPERKEKWINRVKDFLGIDYDPDTN